MQTQVEAIQGGRAGEIASCSALSPPSVSLARILRQDFKRGHELVPGNIPLARRFSEVLLALDRPASAIRVLTTTMETRKGELEVPRAALRCVVCYLGQAG
jgi:hypothetical protein